MSFIVFIVQSINQVRTMRIQLHLYNIVIIWSVLKYVLCCPDHPGMQLSVCIMSGGSLRTAEIYQTMCHGENYVSCDGQINSVRP